MDSVYCVCSVGFGGGVEGWMGNWEFESFEMSARTRVFISRTSSIKDCSNPPLKPSAHLTPSDVIDIFVIVQFCTWSGRPETYTCLIRILC